MEIDKHIFEGLQQDVAEIYQEPKYLRDALNIRLTDRNNNTQMSITKEKLHSLIDAGAGTYIGHCKFLNAIYVFALTDNQALITKIYIKDGYIDRNIVVNIRGASSYFNTNASIKFLPYYENELIQKIYWVQEDRLPRVINVADFNNSQITDVTRFDFVPQLQLKEVINVNKVYGGGLFSPGTILYAITYYNLYGQESNIAQTTPIYYISDVDKAGNPLLNYSNSFNISIENIDNNFDFLRIYSIHRTSLDLTPEVRLVKDIKITNQTKISFVDNGEYKQTVDPTLLLYIGGKEFYAQTITQKDNTLFLGNIGFSNRDQLFIDRVKNILANFLQDITSIEKSEKLYNISDNQYYPKINNLDKQYSGFFKTNQIYRIGLLGLWLDGTWTPPVYINDSVISESMPLYVKQDNEMFLNYFVQQFGFFDVLPGPVSWQNSINSLYNLGIRKIRPVVVYPRFSDKKVLAQGILCPTVFNYLGRQTNTPFAQSSWFFRPTYNEKYKETNQSIYGTKRGQYIPFNNLEALNNYEIGNINTERLIKNGQVEFPQNANELYNPWFFVDENIVTFHSPDLTYNENLWSIDYQGLCLNVIGIVPLNAINGEVNILTSSPAKAENGGSIVKPMGYVNNKYNTFDIQGGAVGGYWWRDHGIEVKNDKVETKGIIDWLVSSWLRTGSLNNDYNHDDAGAQSAILDKKQISNIKIFNCPILSPNSISYEDLSDILLVKDSGEQSINLLNLNYLNQLILYLGTIDSLINATEEYYIGRAGDTLQYSTNPVRMQYNSLAHLVIALPNSKPDEYNNVNIQLLPRVKFYDDNKVDESGQYIEQKKLPEWYYKYSGNKININDYNESTTGYKMMEVAYMGVYLDSNIMSENSNKWVISQKKPDISSNVSNWALCVINGTSPIDNNDVSKKNGYIPDIVKLNDVDSLPSLKINSNCKICIPLGENYLNNTIDEKKQAAINFLCGNGGLGYFGFKFNSLLLTDILTVEVDLSDHEYYYVTFNNTENTQNIYKFAYKETTVKPFSYTTEEKPEWGNNNVVGVKFQDANYQNGQIDTGTSDKYDYSTANFIRQYLWKNCTSILDDEYPLEFKGDSSLKKPVPYLLLAEITRKDNDSYRNNLYGGKSDYAILQNTWVPAGKAIGIKKDMPISDFRLLFEYGDCFFGRYDCLKTYASSLSDLNQIVEIGSFLCESWINFDGRYDNRIGLLNNWTTNNTNFNKINQVYSLKDNFFLYNILPDDFYKANHFANQITWSLTKTSGEDVDLWTNINVSNTLDLNGNNGPINELISLNDNIFAFQDTAISQILYNDRVQINPLDGVPIEISNSNKVSGMRIISDQYGLLNQSAIIKADGNIVFLDGIKHCMCIFNGLQILDISTPNRMFQWFKGVDLTTKATASNNRGCILLYDERHKDLYIITKDGSKSLNFSLKLNSFVSFFSLDTLKAVLNLENKTIGISEKNKCYSLFDGGLDVLGETKSYISFISTDKNDTYKIFDTIDVDGECYFDNREFYNVSNKQISPVSKIEVKNSYQEASKQNPFKKKFRLWRALLPRGNNRERIRNPWTEIKLILDDKNYDVKINSVTVHYTK